MLRFDEDVVRQLNEAYEGADFSERRRANFDMLRPMEGQSILDIGCGTGHLAADLARAIGPSGRLAALDPSPDMRRLTDARLAGMEWAATLDGTAYDIPLPDRSQDGALTVQVFEYVEDLARATAEAARVIKPGGTLVVGDQHFDTFAWHSDNPDRMRRMMAVWDHHFVHRDIPAVLPVHLSAAGFDVEDIKAVPCTDHVRRPNGLSRMLTTLMHAFAVQNGHMEADEADAWRDEQTQLASEGRFFFSLTHYIIRARRR